MQSLFRIIRSIVPMWPWLLATFFCAGIIHISTVFAVPHLATQDAWSRLKAITSENQLYLLPSANSEVTSVLPYMLPDVAYAVCRYDLTKNNLLVHTALADATWNIAISDRYGENFYFISGAEAKRRKWRLLLVPKTRLSEEVSTERSEEGEKQKIVPTTNLKGLVVIRAPMRGPSFAGDTINILQNAQCKSVIAELPKVAPKPLVKKKPVLKPAKKRRRRRSRRHRHR
jgi:uncharacterized membrane protein